jgi:hypothetical protein
MWKRLEGNTDKVRDVTSRGRESSRSEDCSLDHVTLAFLHHHHANTQRSANAAICRHSPRAPRPLVPATPGQKKVEE